MDDGDGGRPTYLEIDPGTIASHFAFAPNERA
jgi:hypothetical protein